MKALHHILPILVIFCLATISVAQMADEAELKDINEKYDDGLTQRPSLSFFDLSKFRMRQSYGISFYSGDGYSGSYAVYNNMISYQLARPLTLTLNFSILHNPGNLWNDKPLGESARFFPSGYLDWRPSENFHLSIGFEQRPAYYDGNYFYNPGRYWLWPR